MIDDRENATSLHNNSYQTQRVGGGGRVDLSPMLQSVMLPTLFSEK